MNEYVFAAIVPDDEAETFLPIEKLYDTAAFTDDLRRHSATATATEAAATAATETTAAATIAEAAAAAEAAAIFKSSAEAATTWFRKPSEIIAADLISLISAASAATSVKTHAQSVTFASP